jgi:hypothetical protein
MEEIEVYSSTFSELVFSGNMSQVPHYPLLGGKFYYIEIFAYGRELLSEVYILEKAMIT